MNQKISHILRTTIEWLTQKTLSRFAPLIVGVTGSVGKTSTKRAITALLRDMKKVRASYANLNTDLGMCLTILGDWSAEDLDLVSLKVPAGEKRLAKALFWLKVIVISSWQLIFSSKNSYPEVLVLEYGADRPGDIKRLLRIARPSVAVITAVGDIPVHVEFYSGPDELAREKAKLIEAVPASGHVILNADDEAVLNIKERTRARVVTFGFSEEASVRITRFEHKIIDDIPVGISFKIEYNGNFVPVRMQNIYGKTHAYAVSAGFAVGLVFGGNLVSLSESVAAYKPADGRMRLLPGLKNSLVLDDSYNASPPSMRAALDVLKTLPAARKIAVLGDMLEIGKYAVPAHEAIGDEVAKIADLLVTVGLRGKLIADAAVRSRMPKKNVISFDNATDAENAVFSLLKEGDLVLVKASHGIHLEQVVKAIRSFE